MLAPSLATLLPDDPLPAVLEQRTQRVYAALRSGADLAIATELPPSGLSFQPLAVLPIWAYVRPEHDWAARGSITVAELVTQIHVLVCNSWTSSARGAR